MVVAGCVCGGGGGVTVPCHCQEACHRSGRRGKQRDRAKPAPLTLPSIKANRSRPGWSGVRGAGGVYLCVGWVGGVGGVRGERNVFDPRLKSTRELCLFIQLLWSVDVCLGKCVCGGCGGGGVWVWVLCGCVRERL